MPIRQKIFFLTIAVVLLLVILELVRRRRLRVEYSWLWLASALTIVLMILRYDLLIWITGLAPDQGRFAAAVSGATPRPPARFGEVNSPPRAALTDCSRRKRRHVQPWAAREAMTARPGMAPQ